MQSAGILGDVSHKISTHSFRQIDNPLSPTCSPALLGIIHFRISGNTTSHCQNVPDEKTGNIVAVDDRRRLLNSEMPNDLAMLRMLRGSLSSGPPTLLSMFFKDDSFRK